MRIPELYTIFEHWHGKLLALYSHAEFSDSVLRLDSRKEDILIQNCVGMKDTFGPTTLFSHSEAFCSTYAGACFCGASILGCGGCTSIVTPVSSRKLHMLWIFFWLYSLVPAGHCPEIAQIEQLICSAIKERSSAFLKLLVDTRHYLHDLFCHTLSMFGHLRSEVWFHLNLCGGSILHIVHQCSSDFYIIGTGVPTGQLAD